MKIDSSGEQTEGEHNPSIFYTNVILTVPGKLGSYLSQTGGSARRFWTVRGSWSTQKNIHSLTW